MRKTALMFMLIPIAAMAQRIAASDDLQKLQMAEYYINMFYVDSVDEKKLVEDAIVGMLEKLDPHSAYSDAEETKRLNEPLQGSFDGIGIQYNMVEDTLLVIQTIANGPSERTGLLPGDRLIAVNDTAIAGVKMANTDIQKRLRGPRGTHVKVSVLRHDIKDTLHFDIIRDKIPMHTINVCYMITPKTGYIRIESFGAKTAEEFSEAVEKLKRQGMEQLVLDLQGNGGGYLQAAVDVADEFLERGEMIVFTKGRVIPRREYRATGSGKLKKIKTIVLIDDYTASAAEILSGALQDNDRAEVVGRRSFGKGLVQRPIDLPDGSMIRLTVSHYYTPSGRCIQKPYTKGNKKDYALDIVNRLKNGELTNPDSIHLADSLQYFTLKRHRVVYGGGGIMPDHFVPLDTTMQTKYHRELSAKSVVLQENLKFVDKHRKELKKKYPDFDKFNREYEVPAELTEAIFAEGEKKDILPNDEDERQSTLSLLRLQLKALIARDLWDTNEYYRVMNEVSDIVKKALSLMGE